MLNKESKSLKSDPEVISFSQDPDPNTTKKQKRKKNVDPEK